MLECGTATSWTSSSRIGISLVPSLLPDSTMSQALVIGSKLERCQFDPDTEELNKYINDLTKWGNRLARNGEQLKTKFLTGLPEGMQDWMLSTDQHNWDNYV